MLLAPYDPLWPLEYAAEADRIAHACDDLPFRLEHIGSTAVPGLGARPVIDIAVGIPANVKRHEYFAAVRQLGYEHKGTDGVPGRDYFVRGSSSQLPRVIPSAAFETTQRRELVLLGNLGVSYAQLAAFFALPAIAGELLLRITVAAFVR